MDFLQKQNLLLKNLGGKAELIEKKKSKAE